MIPITKQLVAILALTIVGSSCSSEPSRLAETCYFWANHHLKFDLLDIEEDAVGKPGLEVYARLRAPVSVFTHQMVDACGEGRATEEDLLAVKLTWKQLGAAGLDSRAPLSSKQVDELKAVYERLIALIERLRPPIQLPLPPRE